MKALIRIAFVTAGVIATAIPARAEDLTNPVAASRAVDLTHRMHPGMAFWPGGVKFTMTRLVDYDQGYRLHKFEIGVNTGTHVDAPGHFAKGKRAIDQLTLAELIVPAVVIDVRAKVAGNPDYETTPGDIAAWEARHGRIPAGSLVILNTGWHARFTDPARYINMDAAKVMHFPGFHPASAAPLIARDIAGVGIDTLSLDNGRSRTFGFHVAMLKSDRYQIENMANLDALPATGATVVVGVLPVKDGSQAQARIIALLP